MNNLPTYSMLREGRGVLFNNKYSRVINQNQNARCDYLSQNIV